MTLQWDVGIADIWRELSVPPQVNSKCKWFTGWGGGPWRLDEYHGSAPVLVTIHLQNGILLKLRTRPSSTWKIV